MEDALCWLQCLGIKRKSILDMGTTLCARGELELFPLLWQEPVKHRATGQLSVLSVPCVQRVHFCFLCGLEQGVSVSVVL